MLLSIHFPNQWFSLFDEAVEDALNDVPVSRVIADIDPGAARIPGATTVRRFRYQLEEHRHAPNPSPWSTGPRA